MVVVVEEEMEEVVMVVVEEEEMAEVVMVVVEEAEEVQGRARLQEGQEGQERQHAAVAAGMHLLVLLRVLLRVLPRRHMRLRWPR